MKEHQKVNVTLVTCGKFLLYNAYLPGNKHAARNDRKIEDVYNEISDVLLPKGRKYVALSVGGNTLDDDAEFSMPTIRYVCS